MPAKLALVLLIPALSAPDAVFAFGSNHWCAAPCRSPVRPVVIIITQRSCAHASDARPHTAPSLLRPKGPLAERSGRWPPQLAPPAHLHAREKSVGGFAAINGTPFTQALFNRPADSRKSNSKALPTLRARELGLFEKQLTGAFPRAPRFRMERPREPPPRPSSQPLPAPVLRVISLRETAPQNRRAS